MAASHVYISKHGLWKWVVNRYAVRTWVKRISTGQEQRSEHRAVANYHGTVTNKQGNWCWIWLRDKFGNSTMRKTGSTIIICRYDWGL